MTTTANPFVGVGLYSLPQAAQLLGVSAQKVRRWLSPAEGVVHRRLSHEDADGIVTFLELIELHFIKMFRDEGVSLQTIRQAACVAARRFETDYPFAVKQFDTDGRSVFATLERQDADKVLVEDLARGQYVFREIIRPFFRKLEYGVQTEEVIRYWPLKKTRRVVLDPARRFGQPIDAESGVETRALYDAVVAGEDEVVVARWFDVPLRAVRSAVEFEEALKR